MNNVIKDIAIKSKVEHCVSHVRLQEFAELIVEEHMKLLRLRWYDLNNREVTGEETPRDIGFRVGQKSEDIWMIEEIKKHFGINND